MIATKSQQMAGASRRSAILGKTIADQPVNGRRDDGGMMVEKITNRLVRAIVLLVLAVSSLGAPPAAFRITPDVRAALNHISADSLRGHLSFIASDALEGRGTPSRGLDLAAEYIAAQFRRVGLEPAGDDGYFQTAPSSPDNPDSPKVHNVAGILRGSDANLKDTYVMLTSHYDHIGVAES